MVNCRESAVKVNCSVSERRIQGLQKQNVFYKRVFGQANIPYPYYSTLRNYRIPRLSESRGPSFREYRMESIISRQDAQPHLKYRDQTRKHASANGSPSLEQSSPESDVYVGPLQLTSSFVKFNFQNGFLKPQVPKLGRSGNWNSRDGRSNGVSCESNGVDHSSRDSRNMVNGFGNSTEEVYFTDENDEEDLENEFDDDEDILVIGLSKRQRREVFKWGKFSSRR